MSFGDIVALAGDFFGNPSKPISQSDKESERLTRFWDAYNMFSNSRTGFKGNSLDIGPYRSRECTNRKFKTLGKKPSEAWESKRLGLRHEMAFAHVTRSDLNIETKKRRVSEEVANAPDKVDPPIKTEQEAKTLWGRVKRKMSSFHAFVTKKFKKGYKAVKKN